MRGKSALASSPDCEWLALSERNDRKSESASRWKAKKGRAEVSIRGVAEQPCDRARENGEDGGACYWSRCTQLLSCMHLTKGPASGKFHDSKNLSHYLSKQDPFCDKTSGIWRLGCVLPSDRTRRGTSTLHFSACYEMGWYFMRLRCGCIVYTLSLRPIAVSSSSIFASGIIIPHDFSSLIETT